MDVGQLEVIIDDILARGTRPEILCLLALLSGRVALAKERVRELRTVQAPPRTLTVGEATRLYPVSRSFLYERGEQLGIAHRVDGTRKLVIDEGALRTLLAGQR